MKLSNNYIVKITLYLLHCNNCMAIFAFQLLIRKLECLILISDTTKSSVEM